MRDQYAVALEWSHVRKVNRSPQALIIEISADQKTVGDLLGKDNAALRSQSDRVDATPKLVPVLNHMQVDLGQLLAVAPQYKQRISILQQQVTAMLLALGDKTTIDRIQTMAGSKDPEEAIQAQSLQFQARWETTQKTTEAQTPLVDELEKLDRANPQSIALTVQTAELSRDAASPDLNKRMLAMATDEMNNPAAASIKHQLTAMQAAEDKVASAEISR